MKKILFLTVILFLSGCRQDDLEKELIARENEINTLLKQIEDYEKEISDIELDFNEMTLYMLL